MTGQGHRLQNNKLEEKAVRPVSPVLMAGGPGRERTPMTHHIFNLAVPIAEDDGVRGVSHWQHHCKGDAHGDWDQGVEWIYVQRFGLGEERIHRSISLEIRLAFPVLTLMNVL